MVCFVTYLLIKDVWLAYGEGSVVAAQVQGPAFGPQDLHLQADVTPAAPAPALRDRRMHSAR